MVIVITVVRVGLYEHCGVWYVRYTDKHVTVCHFTAYLS